MNWGLRTPADTFTRELSIEMLAEPGDDQIQPTSQQRIKVKAARHKAEKLKISD